MQRLSYAVDQIREMVCGLEEETPLFDGRRTRYINLDNAATTPPLRPVVDCVNDMLKWYSSVHRGTGYKSLFSSHLYEQCRNRVFQFVGADPSYHTAVFCSNTTDAINRLCRCMPHEPDDIVLTTVMEHHSTLLPWRFSAQVEYAGINGPNGTLDMQDLEAKLRRFSGRVKLVAVTGASNVTGIIPPIHQIAGLAHQYGARILVDAAQLIAHRPIAMGSAQDPDRIDFLAFSGHKVYAPFGSGALIGPRECFEHSPLYPVGGGTVELVTLDEVEWADLPDKLEAGTPNLPGAVALAKSLHVLQQIGMENVARHEKELTGKLLHLLARIPGICVYGLQDLDDSIDRVGVIPIISDKMHHALLSAVLSYEYGIGVRHGCFCAHPYVGQLLGISDDGLRSYVKQIRNGDRTSLPGFLRISLGIYNNQEEIEYLAEALSRIMEKGPQAEYVFDQASGQYTPRESPFLFDSLLSL